MEHDSTSEDGSRSVHLQITELQLISDDQSQNAVTSGSELTGVGKKESTDVTSSTPLSPVVRAPEKKLTLFALRLAVLEKSATGLGTLGFIWATVVLLGGFAITLDKTDFWVITVILLFEATRIFSRSHELEWQHQSIWSITESGINGVRLLKSSSMSIWRALKHICRLSSSGSSYDKHKNEGDNRAEKPGKTNGKHLATRRWESSEVPILPYAPWVFMARNISEILQCLQIAAAIACIVLSLMKLIMRNYGAIEKGDTDKRNRKAALNIFYSLALAEASLFLLEKVYWLYKVFWCKILEKVNLQSDLGPSGVVSVRRFFYDAYSKCISGSIFDGLKMDMVSFAMELLGSNLPDEQLMGAQILRRFSVNEQFSDDTLQKIGMNFSTVERLVEMLNWKHPQEVEIRKSAAETLSKLAGKKQNSLRVAWIAGAMESIGSLLHRTSRLEIGERSTNVDQDNDAYWAINNLGLLILQKLARDHDSCRKIGNARDLLPKIIDFTHIEERALKSDNVTTVQIQIVKRSLQVIKRLASSTGDTGKQLRKEISENIFTIINIREILHHGQKHPKLQKLAIDILTRLAMEDGATQKIERTGGILKELLNIFFNNGVPKEWDFVRTAAGEALVMLALESKSSCHRIIKLGALEKLVKALEDTLLCVNAAGILRNLCTYSPDDCFEELRVITVAMPRILEVIVSKEIELQEAMTGLAARAFKFMTCEESGLMFKRSEVKEQELAMALIDILKKHQYPSTRIPRIRRFAIELATWMMRDQKNIHIFKNLGLENELENVLDSTSEVESFNILSGPVGLSRFKSSIQSLVDTALDLLKNK
ncbi:hypothetical protein Cgig2_000877 [Carnegiea gigantea]|uniref:ARM repeat superfamily protein n=1 Tax=Carnegiea gigantea TaxID=171969 RepID=A0A9Q1Q9P9_9CARY|nr:hypothetical protein Cgig2_000877 [Carnegiea gigantea]